MPILTTNEYETISGSTLTSSETSRFSTMLGIATAQMENALGWPLDPTSWDDTFTEAGKAPTETCCFTEEPATLDQADTVVGALRVFDLRRLVKVVPIDPCTVLNKVKLVRNEVTYKTFAEDDYRLQLENSITPFGKYLFFRSDHCLSQALDSSPYFQLAIDADWEFATLPQELLLVLTRYLAWEFDTGRDLKSESVQGHSYTKNSMTPFEENKAILSRYAGPHGILGRLPV